jgi:signal peptidase I
MATTIDTAPNLSLQRRSLVVAILVALSASYLGVYALSPLVPYRLSAYLVQPISWLLPAAVALWVTRGQWRRLLPTETTTPLLALVIAIGQITVLFLIGLFTQFGKSPYLHTPGHLALNTWYIIALLVGREVTRWFLAQLLRQRGEGLALFVVGMLFWITDLTPHSLNQLSHPTTLFPYLGNVVLPAAGRELLATQLVLLGGPVASFLYSAVITGFEWYSPVLPTPNWLVMAIAGLALPVIGFAIVDTLANAPAEPAGTTQANLEAVAAEDQKKQGASISPLWLITAILGLLIWWFNTGTFGVRPVLVNGFSMEPLMHTGDLTVINTRVSPVDMKVGDIIRFQQDSHFILHRIKKIEHQDGRLVFITQGDNNKDPDPKVYEDQVGGRMLFFIPKVGWVPIKVKQIITQATQR